MSAPVIFGFAMIVLFGVLGWRDGVVKRVIEISGALAALLLTARFAGAVQPWVSERTGAGDGPALLLTWVVLFLLGLLVSRLLAVLISRLVNLTILGGLDRLGGFVLGAALGLLVASALLVAASQVRGGGVVRTECERNLTGRVMYYAAPNFYRQVRRLTGGRVEEGWHRFFEHASEAVEAGKARLESAAGGNRPR